MSKNVSLDKVAQRAGVAKSTVSFVLNNKDNVAPHTKERVLSAMRELGYKKEPDTTHNPFSINLNRDKKNILIYVNPSIRENEVVLTYMAGLQEYAAKSGNLAFSFVMSSSEVESQIQLQFLEQAAQPQAILLIGINSDHPFIQQALQTRKPCLIVNRIVEDPDLSYVSINHLEAGREAARYLIGLGHRHFALVLENYYNESEIMRLEGFAEELAGVIPDALVTLVRRYKAPEPPDGYRAKTLIDLVRDSKMQFSYEAELKIPANLTVIQTIEGLDPDFNPTCVIAANDLTASVTQAGLQAAGLVIPHDLSIMSLNSSSIALAANPQISGIDELWQEQGYLAGKILEDLIEHKAIRSQKTLIKHRLFERASTARPINL